MGEDLSINAAVQTYANTSNEQVQELISLSVVKDQMESEKNLVAQLVTPAAPSAPGYTQSGDLATDPTGKSVDVTM